MNPVPGDVYDAALRLAVGAVSGHDAELVGPYAGLRRFGSGYDPDLLADAAREILKLAVERGVARECRG